MVKCHRCWLNLSVFEIPSLGAVFFASSSKHMVIFLGFQIFMILSKEQKISVIYFLNV